MPPSRMEWRPLLDAYYKRFSTEWVRKQARPPKILYHYTSAAGLQGILDTRRMWATHARFLNDPSELDYGLQLVRQVVTNYRNQGVPAHVEGLFEAISEQWNAFDDEETYVIC